MSGTRDSCAGNGRTGDRAMLRKTTRILSPDRNPLQDSTAGCPPPRASFFARSIWFRCLLDRMLIQSMAALLLWQAASLASRFIAFSPGFLRECAGAILSILVLALCLPVDPSMLRRELRKIDSTSLFEALDEMPPGEARQLVSGRLASRFGSAASRRAASRALVLHRGSSRNRRVCIATGAFILCTTLAQSFAMITGGSLLLAPRIAVPPSASGIRKNDDHQGTAVVDSSRESKTGSDYGQRGAAEARAAAERAGRSGDSLRQGERGNRPAGEAGANAAAAPARPENLPPGIARPGKEGQSGTLQGGGTSAGAASDGGARGETREAARDEGSPEENRAASGEASGAAPATTPGEQSGARGWEKTPDTGIPSPFVEYGAWMERVLASTHGKASAASGALEAGEPVAAVHVIASSFRIPAGVQAEEDAYGAFLRACWASRKGGFQ